MVRKLSFERRKKMGAEEMSSEIRKNRTSLSTKEQIYSRFYASITAKAFQALFLFGSQLKTERTRGKIHPTLFQITIFNE